MEELVQAGMVLKSNMATPSVLIIKLTTITHMMFITIPVFIISLVFILATPKMMVLGGLPTGSMKAYEEQTVAGSIR